MPVYEFEGKRPRIDVTAYVSPEATIIGDVVIGKGCYIAPGARLRGDWGAIVVGPFSNVQENCVIHAAPDETVILAERSHIGHGAVLHGPVLEEHVVVGMGAIIMDDVKIGAGAVSAPRTGNDGDSYPTGKIVFRGPGKDHGKIDKKWRNT